MNDQPEQQTAPVPASLYGKMSERETRARMMAQFEQDRKTDFVVAGPVPLPVFIHYLQRYKSVKVTA